MPLLIEISVDSSYENIERDFINNFMNNLSQLNLSNQSSEGDIQNSILKIFHEKPTQNFNTPYKKIKSDEVGFICNICMEPFKENKFKRELHCNHKFHKKCIDKNINKYKNFHCPLCRANVFHNSSTSLDSNPSPVE